MINKRRLRKPELKKKVELTNDYDIISRVINPRLLASPPLITFQFQFHPLVVSLSEIQERAGTCFHVEYTPYPALRGLN